MLKNQIVAQLVNAGEMDSALEFVCATLSSRNYQKLAHILKPLGRKQLAEIIENDLLHAMQDSDVDKLVSRLYKDYGDTLPSEYNPMTNKFELPVQPTMTLNPPYGGETIPGQEFLTHQAHAYSSNPPGQEAMPRNLDEKQKANVIEHIRAQKDQGLTHDGILQQLISDFKLPQDLAEELYKSVHAKVDSRKETLAFIKVLEEIYEKK